MAPDGRAGGWGPVVPGVCTVHRLVLTPTVITREPHAALCPTTNPNPEVIKSSAVGKAVLVSMVLAGSIRVARGDSGEGVVNLRQRHSILTW